jgi:hypothetical protein
VPDIAVSTPQLRIGPPPEGYDGPIETVFHNADTGEAVTLETYPSVDAAQAATAEWVERGILRGDVELRPPTPPVAALERQVADEQAAYDAEQATADVTITDTPVEVEVVTAEGAKTVPPKRGRKPKKNTDLEPTLAIVYVNKRDEEKVDFEGPESKARDKFTATPTPGVGRMELRDANGQVLDTKQPHLASVPADTPPAPEPDTPPVEIPEEGGITGPLDIPDADEPPAAPDPPQEDVADDTPEGQPPAGIADVVASAQMTAAAMAPPPAEGPEEETGQKTLVDRSQYDREDLALPLIDGQQIDRIAFAFTGQIMLDRSDPADVALWRKLTLGHDVSLKVEGVCAGYSGKGATNRDGDLDVVVGVRRIKVHTIYLPIETDDEAA